MKTKKVAIVSSRDMYCLGWNGIEDISSSRLGLSNAKRALIVALKSIDDPEIAPVT